MAYFATVHDLLLSEDVLKRFESHKLFVTARLSMPDEQQLPPSKIFSLGHLQYAEGTWGKQVQLNQKVQVHGNFPQRNPPLVRFS